jgi:hypothetical protein
MLRHPRGVAVTLPQAVVKQLEKAKCNVEIRFLSDVEPDSVSAIFELLPHNLLFIEPVTIAIEHSGANAESLRVRWRELASEAWTDVAIDPMSDATSEAVVHSVDQPIDRIVIVKTKHFGWWCTRCNEAMMHLTVCELSYGASSTLKGFVCPERWWPRWCCRNVIKDFFESNEFPDLKKAKRSFSVRCDDRYLKITVVTDDGAGEEPRVVEEVFNGEVSTLLSCEDVSCAVPSHDVIMAWVF